MQKFRFSDKKTRNLIVSMTLSFVVAMPMLAQPLGLSFAIPQADPSALASEVQVTAPVVEETAEITETTESEIALEPIESYEAVDLAMNRSMDEDAILALLAAGEEIDANYEEDQLTEDDEIDLGETEQADPVSELAAHTLYIGADSVNLRESPTTESPSLGKLAFGEKVVCTGETTEWMKVKDAKGREGYVFAIYTSKAMVFKAVSESVYVTASAVNLRSEPTTSSTILQKLNKDQKLTRTGIGDGWSRIKTSTGKTAYVSDNFLTKTVPASLRTTTKSISGTASSGTTVVNKSGDRIVDLAYSMLGVRYVFSGESRSGVDCSGLIYYIYRQIGVTVPRTSSAYASFGTSVSRSEMKAGDVIAWDTRKNDGRTSITHVGIYVGGGNMIHASSSNRKVVITTVSRYESYGMRLLTIRRIRA